MKRPLLVVSAYLFVGMLLNVLVAWGCALWLFAEKPRTVVPGGHRWVGTVPEGWPPVSVVRVGRALGGSAWRANAQSAMQNGQRADMDQLIRSWGLPLRSLSDEQQQWGISNGGLYDIDLSTYRSGLSLGDGARGFLRATPTAKLPLRPVWPGFLVNSMLFGIMTWVTVRGPWRLRRELRRRRGVCVTCAYPRGDAETCSECGRREE